MSTSRPVPKKERLAHRRNRRKVIGFIVVIVLIIFGYAGLGFALTYSSLGINKVAVSGNVLVSTGQLEASALQGLATVRGYILYGGTIATYNEEDIKDALAYKYPRLDSIELTTSKIDTLNIHVTERSEVALWCSNTDGLERSKCYFLDKDGFIFEEDTVLEDSDGLVFYKSTMAGAPLRQTLLPLVFIDVQEFIESLKSLGIKVNTVTIVEDELEIESTTHPMLKVRLDTHLARTVSYLEATLNSKDYQVLERAEDSSKSYIDLRFGNRIYYK